MMVHGFAQQGWQCPCCGSVYSPTTPMCLRCPPKAHTAPSTPPAVTGIVCGKCGADRLAEGCRLHDKLQCTFAGVAQ